MTFAANLYDITDAPTVTRAATIEFIPLTIAAVR